MVDSKEKLKHANKELLSSNSQLEESIIEILHISNHDALTDLYNRRYYEDNLSKLDIPENYPLTIVISDINGLKLINDAFGHQTGDKLLVLQQML